MATAYVFLHRRPLDKQAWPVIYDRRELAESCQFRVSEIVEVVLPTEKTNGTGSKPGQ